MPAPGAAADGRVALVTGGGSGIGRASALAFAREGARVVVADVDGEGTAGTVDAVERAGGEAFAVHADVADEEQVAAMVGAAVERFGRLDAAHNNAGVTGPMAYTADYPTDAWQRLLSINLTGVFLCLKHEIPAMLASGGGAIVNTSSGAGLVGFPGDPGYVASKHGIVGLTRAAAVEYANQGVRVNAVCPGAVRTPMLEAWMGGDETMERLMTQSAPILRLGTPEEIAEAVVWLCSDAASFVVGAAFSVDGGAVAQ